MPDATPSEVDETVVLAAERLFTPDEVYPPLLAVRGDVVIAVGGSAQGLGPVQQVDGTLIPAMIDLQVNGGADVDLQLPRPSRSRLHQWLKEGGILTYVPTLISAPLEEMADLAPGLPGELYGVTALRPHLEGPFIAKQRRGAHSENALKRASWEQVADLGARVASYVTLAPERPGAEELIRSLRSAGVRISAGHSDATIAQAEAAFDSGVSMVTHLFNGMAPLHHREPGLAGAALMGSHRPWVGIIADGVHVSPEMVRLAAALLGERMYVVSDAVSVAGAGAREIRSSSGSLAGSTYRLDHALHNLIHCAVPPTEPIRSVTATPAPSIGLEDRGRLVPGSTALVAVMDATWCVHDSGPARAVGRRNPDQD